MQVRIRQRPTRVNCDGLRFDAFEVGRTYDVGPIVGAILLAEGWAEPARCAAGTATQAAPGGKELSASARPAAIETLSNSTRAVHADDTPCDPDGIAPLKRRDKDGRC